MKMQEDIARSTKSQEINEHVDRVFWVAMAKLHGEGVPLETLLDRVGTMFAGHCTYSFGKVHAATTLRRMAWFVEEGLFDSLPKENAMH